MNKWQVLYRGQVIIIFLLLSLFETPLLARQMSQEVNSQSESSHGFNLHLSQTHPTQASHDTPLLSTLFPFHSYGVDNHSLSLHGQTDLNDLTHITKKISGEWRVRVQGRHFLEKQNNFSGTEFSFLSYLKYQVVPILSFHLKSQISFKNDHVRLEYRDDYSNNNFKIQEATTEIKPWSILSFKAGAINQSPYSSPIFVYGRSLPGIVETFKYQMGPVMFQLRTQQTLATAHSFSAERSESENTPVFNREIVGLEWEWLQGGRIKAYASHFMFDHLAAVTAADGAKLGHFTLGSGSAAKFRYKFAGLTAHTEVSYGSPDGPQILGGWFWLNNQEAKIDKQGQSLYLQGRIPISRCQLSLSYMNFFKEREAAPAVFSSLSLGGNNRMGQSWKAGLSFKDLGLKVVVQLIDIDIIKESEGGRRGKARSYYLGVETLNVKF